MFTFLWYLAEIAVSLQALTPPKAYCCGIFKFGFAFHKFIIGIAKNKTASHGIVSYVNLIIKSEFGFTYCEIHMGSHFLMQLHDSHIFAYGLHILYNDNLADDIALALGVVSVRIAPIPDKISTVGIEVPNRIISTVYLRDIIDSPKFLTSKADLTFAIGKDIGGNPVHVMPSAEVSKPPLPMA